MSQHITDSHGLRRATVRWFGYEREQVDVLAEDALAQVFAALPELALSEGFADRVMYALRPVSWIDRAAAHWGVRAAALLCLVQVTLMVGALSVTSVVLGQHVGVEGMVVFFAQAGVSAMELAQDLVASMRIAGGVAQALARALASPLFLAVALGCTVLASLTLYWLVRGTSFDSRKADRRKGNVGATAA